MNTMRDLDMSTKEYSKREVISNFKWRKGLIPLRLSNHAKRRVEERILGEFVIVPTVCRITENNICSGRSKDGKKLISVKIRLEYTKDKWLYLVVCPDSGVVKTLFLNYKDAKKEKASKERQGIEKGCCVKEKATEGNFEIKGFDSLGAAMELIPGDMEGEKETRRQKLFRNIRRILREGASFIPF